MSNASDLGKLVDANKAEANAEAIAAATAAAETLRYRYRLRFIPRYKAFSGKPNKVNHSVF